MLFRSGVISVKRIKNLLKNRIATKDQNNSWSSAEKSMITIAKSNTPEELLETFKNKRDAKVVGNEKKLLKEAKQIGLINEVINVIIYNSLIVNDTTNLTENNFLKAVNDFSYKKINSAEDALNIFRNCTGNRI